MSSRLEIAEFQAAYLAEVEELLSTANTHLLAIDAAARRGEDHPRGVRELFRALHTVKGLSAMVGVEPVVEVAHQLETALRDADRAGAKLPPGAVDTLLQGVRAIEHQVRALAAGEAVPAAPRDLLDALDALAAPPVPPAPVASVAPAALEPAVASRLSAFELDQLAKGVASGRRAVRGDFVPSPARAAAGFTINTVRERLARVAEIVKVVPVARPPSEAAPGGLAFALLVLTDAPDDALAEALGVAPGDLRPLDLVPPSAPAAPAASVAAAARREDDAAESEPQRRGVVRVEVGRLDAAMERLSTLLVTRFRLERAVAALPVDGAARRDVAQILADHARQLRDLRAAIVRVRMVPVTEVLERVPLLVRGLCRATGKLVRLALETGRAELDKAVAERIFPALVHLVRNAVDHAIELPDERRRLGKPEEGLLRITCHESANGRLEIAVEDDGRGIDAQAVARRAGASVPATDAALLDLLCTPGLSTRDDVTATSGRGMGMDIVRRIVVADLGGELALRTRAGAGTAFAVRVPLTISIVDAFAFECAAQRFVAPVAVVEEILEVDPAAVVYGPAQAGGGAAVGLIARRGEAMPLVGLAGLFGLGAPEGEGHGAGRRALVVRRGGEPVAFAVDRMLGQQEVVVRPIDDPLLQAPGIAGATDLGDGRPTLVLDLVALGARRPA